jgi:glutathionylspermidine synthase
MMFDCFKWDMQSEDHSVLADFPLILEEDAWNVIATQAERLTVETLAAERELVERPDLHRRLGLSRKLRNALKQHAPNNVPVGCARVMRFDFHWTADEWRISEVNSDVPGGFIEASGFAEMMSEYYSAYAPPPNPASAYADAIAATAGNEATIGLVHATANSDDAQVMHYLAQGLQRKGLRTVVIGPSHLKWVSGFARIASSFAATTPAVLVRFFPAEWLPNLASEATWKPWFCGGKTAMSNPGCAILTQSKRFPLVWGELNAPLATWRSLLPETKCPREVPTLSSEWVLKPILGRVGQDVGIAGVTEARALAEIIKNVKRDPDLWIAQRRFETTALQTHAGPREVCLGVFTVDGRAAGVYGRIATNRLIDQDAQDIAVLIRRKIGQ